MREDELLDVVNLHFRFDQHGGDHNDFRGVAADEVAADQALADRINQYFADAVTAGVLGHVATAVVHRDTGHLERDALGLTALFRFADAADFRVGVDDRGYGVVTHEVAFAEQGIDHHFGFAVGDMGEHPDSVDVAGGIDARNVGLAPLIDDDASLFHQDAEVFQAKTGGHRAAADGEQDLGRSDRLLAGAVLEIDGAVLDRGDRAVEREDDALLFVVLLQNRGNLAIGRPGDLVEHFDHGHLGSDRIEVAGHFQADHAAADHNQRFGDELKVEDFAVGQDEAVFQSFAGAGDGRDNGFGTRGDDQLRRFEGLVADLDRDHALAAPDDFGQAFLDGDVAGFELRLDAGDEVAHDLVLAGNDGLLVDRGSRRGDAVILPVLRIIENLGAVEQRLGGDTAFIEADAANDALFDQQCVEPAVAGAFRREVAGRAAANDDEVKHELPGILSLLIQFVRSNVKFSRAILRSFRKRAAGAPSMAR